MDFEYPITRARLQNIRGEYERIQRNKSILSIVEFMTTCIINNARSFAKKNMILRFADIAHNNKHCPPIQSCIVEIIEKMHERFVDVSFTVDPAQTYFFVDWS